MGSFGAVAVAQGECGAVWLGTLARMACSNREGRNFEGGRVDFTFV